MVMGDDIGDENDYTWGATVVVDVVVGVIVELLNKFVGSAVNFVCMIFRWLRNMFISFGLIEATPLRTGFRFRFCLYGPNGFRCLRPALRCLFVNAILLSIWLSRKWCELSSIGWFNLGKTAPTPIRFFGCCCCFLLGFFFSTWWCCFPIRFFSTCSNPCKYSLNRIFVNLLSISSTSSTSSAVILRTRLLFLNVNRLCITSFDRIIGIFMPVWLIAVSISHSKFFARINKYSNARVLLMFSLRMVSCRNCFHRKYWNAPTYTCVSIWRFRKWIYTIEKKKKQKEEKKKISFKVNTSKMIEQHLYLGGSGSYAYWKRIMMPMPKLWILATI